MVAPGPWVTPCSMPPTVEKIRATFTILRAFGSMSTGHSLSATRFTMVMSLDFNATGRVTAAQLQVRPPGGWQRRVLGVQCLQPHLAEPTFPAGTLECVQVVAAPQPWPAPPHLTQSPRKSRHRASRPVCTSEYGGDEIVTNKYIIQPLIS